MWLKITIYHPENIDLFIAKILVDDIREITMERMMNKITRDGFFHDRPILDVKTYCIEKMLCKCTFGVNLTDDQLTKILQVFTPTQLLKVNKKLDDGTMY